MITRLSHATIYVLDQEKAKHVYTEQLGFELDMDMTMDGGFRWLTVHSKADPGLNLLLYGVNSPNLDAAMAAHVRAILEKDQGAAGVLETDDCQRTYEELRGKGIEFNSPPQQQFYGVEATFKDGCGNWFSLTQRAAMPAGQASDGRKQG